MQQHESHGHNLKIREAQQMAPCSVWALGSRCRIKYQQQMEIWKINRGTILINRKKLEAGIIRWHGGKNRNYQMPNLTEMPKYF